MAKKLGLAVLIGGAFSVVGQLIMYALSALGVGVELLSPLTMVCMALLGLLCTVIKIADPLDKLSPMGVAVPISGMAIAIGMATEGAARGAGNNFGAGAKVGGMLPLKVLGTGSLVSLALSAIACFGGLHLGLFQAGEAMSAGILQVIAAFLCGGILAALFQLAMELTKAKPPVLLIVGIIIGALFCVFGIDQLPIFDNAGYGVSILSAGQAVYSTSQLLFMGITPIAFCTVLCVYLFIAVCGITTGFIRFKRK